MSYTNAQNPQHHLLKTIFHYNNASEVKMLQQFYKKQQRSQIDCAAILWQLIHYLSSGYTLKTEQSERIREMSKRIDQRQCGQALDLLVLPS